MKIHPPAAWRFFPQAVPVSRRTGTHFRGRKPRGQLLLALQLPPGQAGLSHFFTSSLSITFQKRGHDKAFKRILLWFGQKVQSLRRENLGVSRQLCQSRHCPCPAHSTARSWDQPRPLGLLAPLHEQHLQITPGNSCRAIQPAATAWAYRGGRGKGEGGLFVCLSASGSENSSTESCTGRQKDKFSLVVRP